MPQSRSVDRIPPSCIGCNRHLAVWCHCYSVATRALGLCISCLRCRDVEVCWNCKKAPRQSGILFGGCCAQCSRFRRCSKCDFFEYAPGRPFPGCVCPRCQAPFKCTGCVSCGLVSTCMIAFYTYLVFEGRVIVCLAEKVYKRCRIMTRWQLFGLVLCRAVCSYHFKT